MRFKTGEVAARPTWWLCDEHNVVVAWAGETYADAAAALRAADAFRFAAASTRFELFLDRQGHWRWRADDRGVKVASSAVAHTSQIAAQRAARMVRERVSRATFVHEGPPALLRTAD